MKKTFEEKIELKKMQKEIKETFPNYNEKVTLKKGESNILCKTLGHKKRFVHHAFFTKQTERGKEYYECWICPRCKDIEGKLVNIVE